MTTRRRRLVVTSSIALTVVAVGAGALGVGAGWWSPGGGQRAVAAPSSAMPTADPSSLSPLAADSTSAQESALPTPPLPATESPAARVADRVDRSWPKRPPWDACPAPVWPGTPSIGEPGNGRRVLVVGDSLTRESLATTARLMRASGWTPTFRCWGSKRLDWGLGQVRRAKELGQLPDHVVMALGTNDISWESRSTNERRVREMLRLLGK